MSSFTKATFEPVFLADGRRKKRAGAPVFRVKGEAGDGFRFYIGYEGSGLEVHVEEGYETDVVSGIPPLLRSLLARFLETMVLSAAVHDVARENGLFSKLAGDCLFLMAMEAEGTPPIARELAFKLVRLNDSRTRHNPDELVFAVDMPPY